MAEALVILGLAANVLQFVEQGRKVVLVAYRLYKNRSDDITARADLRMLAVDLKIAMHDILANSEMALRTSLRDLIAECIALTDELLALLEAPKIDRNKNVLTESVKKSVSHLRGVGRIKELDGRIVRIRSQICEVLSLGFMQTVLDSVTSFQTSNEAMLQSMITDISMLAAEVKGQKLQRGGHDDNDDNDGDDGDTGNTAAVPTVVPLADLKRERDKLGGGPNRSDNENNDEMTENEDAAETKLKLCKLIQLVRDGHEKLTKQKSITRILKSLHFPEIKDRISDVHTAHNGTFAWLFRRNAKTNLVQWLESDKPNGVYWISGVAGSGKSTLMKFILNHPDTVKTLQRWSGRQSLAIASHFFWSIGTPLQKSQKGLFMTLLFQVFAQAVDLLPVVCPERWKGGSVTGFEAWTLQELFDTFRALASVNLSSCSVEPFSLCLLIDGLDEYFGDHRELVSVLGELASHARIKICASSRPWVEFRGTFDQSLWKLSLHELTRGDVEKYVRDSLPQQQSHHDFVDAHPADTVASLANRICQRSQGVFLWVYLVVQSLKRGLANHDSLGDLQRRLDELPPDLEGYFHLMLDGIETVYRQRTSRLFKSLLYAESDLPVIAFHFIELEEWAPDYATEDLVGPLTELQMRGLSRSKQYQMTAQCRDLIRFAEDKNEFELFRYRVGFLHRTVADFLRLRTLDEILDVRVGPGFDPRITLSRVFLSMLKSIPRSWAVKDKLPTDRVGRLMLGILSYARDLEVIRGHSPSRQSLLLDQLQCEMQSLAWAYHWRSMVPESGCESVFDIAARCGLWHYLEHLSSRKDLDETQRARLLQQTLKPIMRISLSETFTFQNDTGIDTTALAVLLENKVSPNLPSPQNCRFTVWSEFLWQMSSHPSGDEYRACKLMISAGADRHALDPTLPGQTLDLAATLRSKFGQQQSEVLVSLLQPSPTASSPSETSSTKHNTLSTSSSTENCATASSLGTSTAPGPPPIASPKKSLSRPPMAPPPPTSPTAPSMSMPRTSKPWLRRLWRR